MIPLGYQKGLNRDISKNSMPSDAYYFAENIRILADNDSTSYSAVNFKGNDNANIDDNGLVRSGGGFNFEIIGYVSVLNDIVLFYAETGSTSDSNSTESIIDILKYQGNDAYLREELNRTTGLNFRIDKPIKAVSYVEDSEMRKVYWTDNNNLLRFLNIDDTNLSTYDNSYYFELVGPFKFTWDTTLKFNKYTSGSLKPGVIQYAYRFVKQFGQKSVFSPASKLIPISKFIDKNTGQQIKGDAVYNPDRAYSTGIGVILDLNYNEPDIIDFYDYIEVVSMWYSSEESVPDINVIYKGEFINTIIDDGSQSYGTFDYGEFLTQQYDFIVKDLAIKDERLFGGNTKEKFFDVDEWILENDPTNPGLNYFDEWDARAYRWNDNNVCLLYKRENLDPESPEFAIDNNSGIVDNHLKSIDSTADCINLYNRVTEDSDDSLSGPVSISTSPAKCMYQKDGNTVGGEGLNISYYFTYRNYDPAAVTSNRKYTAQPDDEWYIGLSKGYQRDEVYRFGIVFYDDKGRQSFVKWIGDIRFPNTYDDPNYKEPYMADIENLGIVFSVTNIPTGLSYQIVRVRRTYKDKTIVTAGLAGQLYETTIEGEKYYSPFYSFPTMAMMDDGVLRVAVMDFTSNPIEGEFNTTLYELRSPDIKLDQDYHKDYDYLEIAGLQNPHHNRQYLTDHTSDPETAEDVNAIYYTSMTTFYDSLEPPLSPPNFSAYLYSGFSSFIPVDNYFTSRITQTSNTAKTIFEKFSINFMENIGSYIIDNSSASYAKEYLTSLFKRGNQLGFFSKMQAVKLIGDLFTSADYQPGITFPSEFTESPFLYVYGRKNIFDSQYGGYGYEDRIQNTYITSSNINSGDASEYGDVVINMMKERRASADSLVAFTNDFTNLSHDMVYIAESQMNSHLTYNDDYYDYAGSQLERSDVIELRDSGYTNPDTGVILDEQNKLNNVYQKANDYKKFFMKSNLFRSVEENTTKVVYSQNKYGNEDVDQFTIFRTNDFYKLDRNRGALNKLVEFYDGIFSFQDTGVGQLLINPNAVINSNAGEISLGTGDVIQDVKYITETVGCQDNSDIVKSKSAMYWLDKNNKKIYSYSGQMKSITDLHGLHSYLKTNINENSYFKGVYDVSNSEVVMTVNDDTPNTQFTLTELGGNMYSLTGYNFNLRNLLYKGLFIEEQIYNLVDGSWFKYKGENGINSLIFEYYSGDIPIGTLTIDISQYVDERDEFTIAFNEKMQAFTSFYTFIPSLYIQSPKGYFTTRNNVDLYQHDINQYFNLFYGEFHPTKIKWIIGLQTAQGEYNNITWSSEVYDYFGDRHRNKTITTIKAQTDHRISEPIILYPVALPDDYFTMDVIRKYLYTSGTKLGKDYYPGFTASNEEIVAYNGELYRSEIDSNSSIPPTDYTICELGNLRKTINKWSTAFPRIINPDEDYPYSDRLRGDWVELEMSFKDILYPEYYKINLKDVSVNTDKL